MPHNSDTGRSAVRFAEARERGPLRLEEVPEEVNLPGYWDTRCYNSWISITYNNNIVIVYNITHTIIVIESCVIIEHSSIRAVLAVHFCGLGNNHLLLDVALYWAPVCGSQHHHCPPYTRIGIC